MRNDGLQINSGKSFVGNVDDVTKARGWFFGSFMDVELLKSDLVEVAWQQLPNVKPSADQAHFHRSTAEVNIVIQGWIELVIDGENHHLDRRQFYVIWPESVVSDISTSDDAELIVIRAPGIANDKVIADATKS